MANVSPLILASGSTYRASVLRSAGIDVRIEPPDIDERALDDLLDPSRPEVHAVELALRKAHAILSRFPNSTIIAADQIGIVDDAAGPVVLHKRPDVESAVAQLMKMSGTTHRLINGVVVIHAEDSSGVGRRDLSAVDVMHITMRSFSEAEARAYVERFEPFDCSGSYRIEDQESMEPDERLIQGVEGEDVSGVLGMPVPLLKRMLDGM